MTTSVTAVVAGARRRNGKIPSCEPCRKGKVRCDHQRPVCARCLRRGLQAECFFHPAPLTKSRDSFSTSVLPTSPTTSIHRQTANIPVPGYSARPETSHTDTIARSWILPSPLPSFTGLGEDELHKHYVQSARSLAEDLQHVDLLWRVLHEFYELTAAALVPGFFIEPALLAMQRRWNQSHDHEALLDKIANELVDSSKASVEVHAHTSIAEFCAQQHGERMNIEMLGLLFTVAARACLYGLARDEENRNAFIQRLCTRSNEALRLAREIAPRATDALLWLQFENLTLNNALHGDNSSTSWRRLGDLATDVTDLGLHREASYAGLPFFLAQTRRRTFAGSYNLDKLMASMHGRPPRILKRFSDCQPPLDLTWELLRDSDPDPSEVLKTLTSDGFNKDGKYSSSSWIRLRSRMYTFREEFMEFAYCSLTPEKQALLRDLSRRNCEGWNSLPQHLRYWPECWTSGLATTVCIMLTSTFLSYRQLDFQIYRLLESADSSNIDLWLQIAEEIFGTILHVGSFRDRAWYTNFDFEFLMLVYGIPSALTLAAALERATLTRTVLLPANLSRSALIRNLSVFVSMLEGWHGTGETNKTLCSESAKAISQTLDRALDSPSEALSIPHPRTATPVHEASSTEVGGGSSAVTPGFDPLMSGVELSFPHGEGFDLLDLSHWQNNIDWASLSSDWANF